MIQLKEQNLRIIKKIGYVNGIPSLLKKNITNICYTSCANKRYRFIVIVLCSVVKNINKNILIII